MSLRRRRRQVQGEDGEIGIPLHAYGRGGPPPVVGCIETSGDIAMPKQGGGRENPNRVQVSAIIDLSGVVAIHRQDADR